MVNLGCVKQGYKELCHVSNFSEILIRVLYIPLAFHWVYQTFPASSVRAWKPWDDRFGLNWDASRLEIVLIIIIWHEQSKPLKSCMHTGKHRTHVCNIQQNMPLSMHIAMLDERAAMPQDQFLVGGCCYWMLPSHPSIVRTGLSLWQSQVYQKNLFLCFLKSKLLLGNADSL